MNINDLIIYIAVYENNSINKAAQNLGYAQSNISQRIQALENYFNQTFFIRSRSGIKSTIEGQEFYKYAIKVNNETKKLQNTFANKKEYILCSELLFNVLYKQKQLKNLERCNFKLVNSILVQEESTKFIYDRIITFNKLTQSTYKLISTSYIEVGMYQYSKNKTASELPLIVSSDSSCPLRTISLNLEPNRKIIELDSLESIINIVKNGEGIAMLPKDNVLNSSLINILENYIDVSFYEYKI